MGFDGGRADPYHIVETKGKVRGSLWLGRKGLQWALGELGNLKHSSPTDTRIFKFMRDGYRTLELSCLSNRGGRYVELSEYHGGAQRGNLRIPEGRHGAGWIRFGTELTKYFLTKLESGVSEQSGNGIARQITAPVVETRKGSNGNNSNPKTVKEVRESWGREDHSAKIVRNKHQRGSRRAYKYRGVNGRVIMSDSEPRPTRKCGFKWDPNPRTFRITKLVGQACRVAWVGVNNIAGPSELKIGPHEHSTGPTRAVGRDDDSAHGEVIPSEASSDEATTETGGYHRKEPEVRLGSEADMEPSPMTDFMAEAACGALRSDPVTESEPENCDNALNSTVRVDLASEDTGMESRDDTMSWWAQEPRQEVVVCNTVSGLEMVLRPDDNQIQAVDSPEYEEASSLICAPLAIIDPLDQVTVAPGSTPKKGTARSNRVNR